MKTRRFRSGKCSSTKDVSIYYWTNERSTSEVDFIIQKEDEIIPVEVKAGENLRAESFKLFCEKYRPPVAIRLSLADYKQEEWLTNLPLYAVGQI